MVWMKLNGQRTLIYREARVEIANVNDYLIEHFQLVEVLITVNDKMLKYLLFAANSTYIY